jgi:hypothetical protein
MGTPRRNKSIRVKAQDCNTILAWSNKSLLEPCAVVWWSPKVPQVWIEFPYMQLRVL